MNLYRKTKAISRIEGLVNTGQLNRKAFETLRDMFTSGTVSLDDLNKVTRTNLYKKMFQYKFLISSYNARNVRCGRKKGYENTKFLLGAEQGMMRRLNKNRPDLVEKGIAICRRYIEKGFDSRFAPALHRVNRFSHYQMDNINIMTVDDHDKETQKERQQERQQEEKDNKLVPQ